MVRAVVLLEVIVVSTDACPPVNDKLPSFLTINLVVPDADAVKISWLSY